MDLVKGEILVTGDVCDYRQMPMHRGYEDVMATDDGRLL
jgi:hypothetical protein